MVRSLLGGRDVAVVMPTGGGKSLCYQLPAVLLGKTAVVVSPLIALMQDQAANLAARGIPAAVLNSSMEAAEQSRVIRAARGGDYRLLYLSPERLVREDTHTWLRNVPIAYFAIDEAHCISEWGHEFRPEYGQLGLAPRNFPDHPIAAFTASATRRVRHDMLRQLRLREPDTYILSFHRPNLRYLIRECSSDEQRRLLLAAMESHRGRHVIVYAPTINRVEETVAFLEENGFASIPYHGRMDGETRQRHQERWMADEVRVLVGTIAFGLGIDKPDVRAVIHLSLPKSLEQYYQEAGRAGRDGLPSDCALLWQKRDAGLLAHFIQQIQDPDERSRSWERYRTIRAFVEREECRHLQICRYFGQRTRWTQCGACDVCGPLPEWLNEPAPKPRRRWWRRRRRTRRCSTTCASGGARRRGGTRCRPTSSCMTRRCGIFATAAPAARGAAGDPGHRAPQSGVVWQGDSGCVGALRQLTLAERLMWSEQSCSQRRRSRRRELLTA